MIRLSGLNGSTVLVAPKSIFRIRATTPAEGADAIKVEYGGGYLFTLETIASLRQRLSADINLIRLTSRSNVAVYLNAAAITRVREALPINGPGTEIVVAGQYQHVIESVQEVEALLAA